MVFQSHLTFYIRKPLFYLYTMHVKRGQTMKRHKSNMKVINMSGVFEVTHENSRMFTSIYLVSKINAAYLKCSF